MKSKPRLPRLQQTSPQLRRGLRPRHRGGRAARGQEGNPNPPPAGSMMRRWRNPGRRSPRGHRAHRGRFESPASTAPRVRAPARETARKIKDRGRPTRSKRQHFPSLHRLHKRQKERGHIGVLQLQKYSVDRIRLAFPRDAPFPYFRFRHIPARTGPCPVRGPAGLRCAPAHRGRMPG
jgi:hypothetical protein